MLCECVFVSVIRAWLVGAALKGMRPHCGWWQHTVECDVALALCFCSLLVSSCYGATQLFV